MLAQLRSPNAYFWVNTHLARCAPVHAFRRGYGMAFVVVLPEHARSLAEKVKAYGVVEAEWNGVSMAICVITKMEWPYPRLARKQAAFRVQHSVLGAQCPDCTLERRSVSLDTRKGGGDQSQSEFCASARPNLVRHAMTDRPAGKRHLKKVKGPGQVAPRAYHHWFPKVPVWAHGQQSALLRFGRKARPRSARRCPRLTRNYLQSPHCPGAQWRMSEL